MGKRFAEGHGLMAMEDLHAERWWLAEGTARAAVALADDDETRANAQVNLWLARSGRLGPDAVRPEVEEWDPTALDPTLLLARLVLLERDEEAAALAAECRTRDQVSSLALREWPLFARMRRLGLLDHLI